jgi:hypothetical protein
MQLKLFTDIPNNLLAQTHQWLDNLEFMDSLPSSLECEAILAWEQMIAADKNRFCRATAGVCLN